MRNLHLIPILEDLSRQVKNDHGHAYEEEIMVRINLGDQVDKSTTIIVMLDLGDQACLAF